MSETATLKGPANAFDSWRSISIAIFMALVGYTVMVSVPVLSRHIHGTSGIHSDG